MTTLRVGDEFSVLTTEGEVGPLRVVSIAIDGPRQHATVLLLAPGVDTPIPWASQGWGTWGYEVPE